MDFANFSNRQMAGIGIVALLLLVSIVGYAFLPQSQFTITSVSEVEYESNSDWWDGEGLVITWIEDSSTQDVNVYLEESYLSSETGQDVQEPINIDVDETEQSAVYDIQANDFDDSVTDLVNYRPMVSDEGFYTSSSAEDWAYDNCDSYGGDDLAYLSTAYTRIYVYCFEDTGIDGHPHRLSSPTGLIETEFEVENPATGESVSETIGSGDTGDGRATEFEDFAGNTFAHIQWQGNLGTGDSAPEPHNELGYYDPHSDSWTLINEQNYQDWRQYFEEGQAMTDLENWGEGLIDQDNVESNVISRENDATDTYVGSPLYGKGEWEGEGGTFGDGQYVFTDDGELETVFPQFTLTVKGADFVTIGVDVGEPEFAGITSPSLDDDGNVPVSDHDGVIELEYELENVGEAEGSFTSHLDCSMTDSFTALSTSETNTVGVGDTETFTQSLSFSGDEEVVENCEIEYYDISEPTDTRETETIGVASEDLMEECSEEGYFRSPDGEAILFCEDGETSVVEQCDDGEEAVIDDTTASGYACEETGDGNGVGNGDTGVCEETLIEGNALTDEVTWTNPVCQIERGIEGLVAGTQDAMQLVNFAMGILVFIFSFGFINNDLGKRMEDSVPKPYIVVGGLVTSLILGFATIQFMQGVMPKVLVGGVIVGYIFVKSMIPSTS